MERRCASRKWGLRGSLCALGLLAAAGAPAQPARHGPQHQVNTFTTSAQLEAAVAAAPLGSFVIAWKSVGADGGDPTESVQGRCYDALGQPIGPPFQVETATIDHQFEPAVAMAPDGSFVVAFASYSGTGTDTEDRAIRARRFGATGDPAGDEFQVNTETAGSQRYPAVAVDAATGGFAVVWYGSYAETIQARTFGADGEATGPEVQVSEEESTGTKSRPALAAVGDGEFVVAWEEFQPADELDWGIQAARFDASGTVVVPPFSVNTFTTGNQEEASVASDGEGRFVIAWDSAGSAGTDTHLMSIQARLFDAGGVPGDAFQVNTYTTGYQTSPGVAMDPRGHFVVVWDGSSSAGTDTSSWSIHARPFDETGAPAGDELQVNTYTTNSQNEPAIATDADGNFVVAWSSYGSEGTDVDGNSIQLQRFDDVFREDFEAGDWLRWSTCVP